MLTVKRGAGLSRDEVEVEISPEQFEALWPLTEGRRLRKRRHVLPHDGLEIEVDVYEGELEGLIVAEVEFESEDKARGFEPPAWLGDDVTGDAPSQREPGRERPPPTPRRHLALQARSHRFHIRPPFPRLSTGKHKGRNERLQATDREIGAQGPRAGRR